MPELPNSVTDKQYRTWFRKTYLLISINQSLCNAFNIKHVPCKTYQLALALHLNELRGVLSWCWYIDGPLFFPDSIEEYTHGLIRWRWNDGGECENCNCRDMCYDLHLNDIEVNQAGFFARMDQECAV